MQDPQAENGLATLLRGLRAACPAVTPGGHADWPTADSAYDDLVSTGGLTDVGCEVGNGYLLLGQLVTLHRANPDANFHVASGDGDGYSGCTP
ncbi:hypothetical protein [Streptomyces aquilus]|uniref:hypothetical protein n=1 Tax=Streptomyces aquilus TaxID=2548456 RepID=UPI0036B04A60